MLAHTVAGLLCSIIAGVTTAIPPPILQLLSLLISSAVSCCYCCCCCCCCCCCWFLLLLLLLLSLFKRTIIGVQFLWDGALWHAGSLGNICQDSTSLITSCIMHSYKLLKHTLTHHQTTSYIALICYHIFITIARGEPSPPPPPQPPLQ